MKKNQPHPLSSACFLLITLFVTQHLFAAPPWQLQGRVLEQGSGAPIHGVSVRVASNDALHTTSNEQGVFQLTVHQTTPFRLSFIHNEYQQLESEIITLDDQTNNDFTFYLVNVLTLPEIAIEAEAEMDTVPSRTIVTGKELEQIPGGGGDPFAALRVLPGITTANDAEPTVAVRGSGPQDNMTLVDFVNIGYLFHGFPLTSVLRSDLVESFDLYAAAFGPEYGDAIGAAIDVKQRDPREDRLGVVFNVSLISSDFLVEGPVTENSSFYLAARRSYIDLLLPADALSDDDVEIKEIPVFSDYQGKYVWRMNPINTLRLQLLGASDSIKLNFPEDSNEVKKNPDLLGQTSVSVNFHSQALVLNSEINDQWSNKFSVDHLVENQRTTTGEIDNANAGKANVTIEHFTAREELTWYPDAPHQITFGAALSKLDVDLDLDIKDAICTEFDPECDYNSGVRQQVKESFPILAWYLSLRDQWRISPQLTLSLGARYAGDDYLDETYLEPRLGLEWRYSSHTIFNAGWGKFHQFPEGAQVVKTIGNPDLVNLKAKHSVLGVEHFINTDWSIKLESYYKTFDDLVVSTEEPPFANLGSGKAYGLELLVKKNLINKLSGWFSLTYSKSKRTNHLTGETFPYQLDKPIMANLVGIYKLSNRWTLSGRFTFTSGGAYTPVVGRREDEVKDRNGNTVTDENGNPVMRLRPMYGEFNSNRLPNYHRFDIRADYDLKLKSQHKMEIYLEIMNLYNRENISGYSWNPEITDRKPQKQLGTLPFIGFRFSW